MKFNNLAASVLLTACTGLAAPVADSTTDVAVLQSPNPQAMALAALDSVQLEKRINCTPLKTIIHRIGASGVAVIFLTQAHTLTRDVCELANGDKCETVARVVSIAFGLLYIAAGGTSGAVPVGDSPAKRGEAAMHAAFVDGWIDAFSQESSGLTYTNVTNLPFNTTHEALSRRDGDPALLSRVLLSGLNFHGDNSTQKHDIVVNHYADGNAQLHLPLAENSVDETGAKAPGFKVSYTTRQKSFLSRSQQNEMSAYLSASWLVHADEFSMTDFIGFAEDGHKANFYYRVIPETREFGLNYESVDICGGMGGYL